MWNPDPSTRLGRLGRLAAVTLLGTTVLPVALAGSAAPVAAAPPPGASIYYSTATSTNPTGVPGTGDALWVRVEEAVESNGDTDRAHELAREYQAVVESILESRGVPGLADALRSVDEPAAMADMAGRFAPWVWGAFATLLASGTVLIIGEPERELINWAFWIKVPLLVAAAALTAVFLSRLAGGGERAAARGPALVLVLLWCLVIVFGRLIAYAQITVA